MDNILNFKSYIKKIVIYGKEEIPIYNQEAFIKLKSAGQLAKNTLLYLEPFVKEGISTEELDVLASDFIKSNNAIAAPLNYQGYPKSTCISVNHVICHGIPSKDKKLKKGDIVNIDITVILDGFYGDTSKTYIISQANNLRDKLLVDTTYNALMESIKIVKAGIPLNYIGETIEKIAHKENFSVVEDFCGHGIGHTFHQAPQVLHFVNKSKVILEEGMVFTIEPMINIGKKDAKILNDGWTAVTKDKSLSAQFEHTIGVTSNGCEIFTK
jgi:methionyl aminopeptidase